MSQEIVLKRTDKHWLFTWQPVNTQKSYFVSEKKIRFKPVDAEYARNLFNACYAGLKVHVKAHYNLNTKILEINP